MDEREVVGEQPESVVVTAVAAMTGHGTTIDAAAKNAKIQAAMTAAIEQAQAEGITDVEEMRARILAARDAAETD